MTTTAFTHAPRPGIRFPLQRIMDLTRAGSYAQLAERLGVSADAVRQWARRGLSSQQADWVATKLGYWPGNVWGNFDADVVPEDVDFDGDFVDLVVSEIADSNWLRLNCCQVVSGPSDSELLVAATEADRPGEEPDASTAAVPVAVPIPAPESSFPRPCRAPMWAPLHRMAGALDRADEREDQPSAEARQRPPGAGRWWVASLRSNPGFRPGFGDRGAR